MAVRACSTQVVAWPPSRTHKTTVSVVRYGQEIPTALDREAVLSAKCLPCSYRRLAADRCALVNGVGVLPDVFTVTVPSIQRELCACGVGVLAPSWSTRGLTSGTKLSSRSPLSASSQATGAQALTISLTNRTRMMRRPHRDIRHLPDLYSSLPRQ
jgi:hypothetical protein